MKKHRKNVLNKQSGFTAIELLFALGIIAVATVVIVKMMGSNSDKAKAQQMIEDVSALVDNIKGAYGSSTDGYTNLNNATVIAGKFYPNDLGTSGSDTITNQFTGGTIVIVSTASSSFTITYNKVPSGVCSEVISKLANDTFSTIEAGTTTVYTSSANAVDPSAIANGCANDPAVTFTVTN